MTATLSVFAAALSDALVSAGWQYYPAVPCWRDDASGCEVTLIERDRYRASASVPRRGGVALTSRKRAPDQAGLDVAAKAVAFARGYPVEDLT